MKPCAISIRISPTVVLPGRQFILGPLETNGYVLWDPVTKEAVVIDPGDAAPELLTWLRTEKLKVKKIINTHGHVDHIAGNESVKKQTEAALWIHTADRAMLTNPAANLSLGLGRLLVSPPADAFLDPKQILTMGPATFLILETPGHTPGSVCLLVGDALFSGDTLFAGTVGRTDLPGGDFQQLQTSLKIFRDLPSTLQVFPGHGSATTLGHEMATNPFLQKGSHYEH